MVEPKTLAGRNALITGVAGVIGQAVAGDLKDRGAYVIGVDRVAPPVGSFLDEMIEADLGRGPVPSMPCPAGDLDVVVHLAGRALPGEVESPGIIPDRSVIDQTINDNFVSVLDVVAMARPALRPGSSITVVSSINAVRAFGLPIYSATKGAVNAFVVSIAPRLLAEGIRINAIALGSIERDSDRQSPASIRKLLKRLRRTVPDERFMTAEEASRSIIAVGIDSPGISGTVTVVDRGQSNFVNLGR